ncbi:MAG: O-antigen ligase family protein [Flavobacterium sp.]
MKNKLLHLLLNIAVALNAALLLIPNKFKAYPIILLLIVVVSLAKNVSMSKRDCKQLFLLNLPLLIPSLSVAYSDYKTDGLLKIITLLSLAAYPAIFYLLQYIPACRNNNFEKLLYNTFVFAVTIFGVCSFSYFWISRFTLSETIIHYSNLVNIGLELFSIHPIYFSLYIGVSLLLCMYLITESKNLSLRLIYLCILLINVIILGVLMRKGPIIFFFVACMIWLIRLKSLRFLFLLGTTAVIIIGSIIILPKYKDFNRFTELIRPGNNFQERSSTQIRLDIFNCSVSKIADRPIFGYGMGGVQYELNECYLSQNIDTSVNYNSHNQYFSIALCAGLIGLGGFLIYIVYIIRSIRYNSHFLAITVFFLLNFLTENILERENGVIIYSLFISFFYYYDKRQHYKTNSL